MTKLRVILGSAVAILALIVAANAGAFSGDGGDKRNCGAGVRPRTVAVLVTFQGGYVTVHGFVGPAKFGPDQARKSPFKFAAQACPGESASITAVAIRPPLPTLRADISVGGGTLTGTAIERSGTAGARSVATAVIR